MKKLTLKLLLLYKRFVAPALAPLSRCRYTPTCGYYTYQAVEKYGVLKGLFLGFKRVLRCNPFFKGGVDPLL